MTRARRPRSRSSDRDPELIEALATGTACSYSAERWHRLTAMKYFGEEPDVQKKYLQPLLDRWREEHGLDRPAKRTD